MIRLLEKARNGSNSTKNKIAIILATSFTVLIVGFWLLIVRNQKGDESAKATAREDSLKPFYMIFQRVTRDFKATKENIKNFKSNKLENLDNTVVK